ASAAAQVTALLAIASRDGIAVCSPHEIRAQCNGAPAGFAEAPFLGARAGARAPSRGFTYGMSCAVPGRETAPGPGKPPFVSVVESKAGGMQNTLTRVEGPE